MIQKTSNLALFIKDSAIAPFFQYLMFFLLLTFAGLAIYYLIFIGNRAVEKENKIKINWKSIVRFLLLVISYVILSALFRAYPILGSTLFALFVSVIVAFLLNPIVNSLEKKGIKRGTGIIITYLGILLLIVFLFAAIIPDLVSHISLFLSNLPSSIDYIYDFVVEKLTEWNIDVKVLDEMVVKLNEYLVSLSNEVPKWVASFIETIQGSIGTLVTLVLIPLITFHLLVSKDRIIHGVFNIIPTSIKHDSIYLYQEINFAMNEFVRSRLLMAVFIGVSTGIMLQLFGIPFALVIGFMTMVLDIVPYIGPFLATAPALIFAFIKSPMTFVWVAFLCWALQWIEQNIVGAKLFSDSSGIHEIIILLSIIIGGGMFGVWGMILSVPAVIIFKILMNYASLKLKGIKPEFTKDVEKAIMEEMRKKEKEETKRRKRERRK